MNGWNPVVPDAEALAHLDPYLEFMTETLGAYFFVSGATFEPVVPIVLELRQGRTAAAFAEEWARARWIHIPGAYRRPAKGVKSARYCTATVTDGFFKALADPPSGMSEWVERVAPGLPIQEISVGAMVPRKEPKGRRLPGMVVIGIIDDGLAFTHERFRQGLQTRIEYLWRQDGATGPVPGYGYGREYLRNQIEAGLANAAYGNFVDEEQVYRATRHIDFRRPGHKPVAQRAAHGTHVMDLASRLEPGAVVGDRPIIGVQLPIATTAATAGGTLAKHLLDGLRYIIDRADEVAVRKNSGPLPIVVNVSYGLIAGPHDGSSILEAAIDELIGLRNSVAPFRVVLPAGNSFLARCHAGFDLRSKGRQPLRWRVQPDDRTPSFLEIWLPKLNKGRSKVRVTITTPTGSVSPPVDEGGIYAWQPVKDILCKVIYFNGVAAGRKRNMILVALAPTATLDRSAEVAPSGIWEVGVENAGPAAHIDAWIQRDDSAPGYPGRGRQSYFDDPEYRRFDDAGREIEDDNVPANASYVKRDGTINAIATGSKTIVVGGFRRSDGHAADYSASGPVVQPPGRGAPNTVGPEAMAVSEDSASFRGVSAAGSRSGSCVAMNGSSVAAPQIAHRVAARMASGQPNGRAAIFNEARAQEPGPWLTPAPAPKRGGGGRIDLPPSVDRGIERK